MPRKRSPKRGSMAFSPRKRAKNIKGRIDFWPEIKTSPQLSGFAGYKAGMTHIFYIEDRTRSPEFGKEIQSAATIIDTPPMINCGIRIYSESSHGLKTIKETWIKDIPTDLFKIILPRSVNTQGMIEEIKNFDDIIEIRLITATQPRLASVPKKVPEIMEIPVGGGSIEERFEYAKTILGKTITINDIFETGETIDVIGVTKGKGFQGPVKKWGIRILQHKSRKTKRGVASIGPWVPRRVMPQVPRAGQMGYHQRTEYNKRIMLMGNDGERITPIEGFNRYGNVTGDYLLLKGSVMGPSNRLIKMRKSVRKSKYPIESPSITYLQTEWKKGE